jgi:triosephosphate isomerase (TIM)
MPSDARRRLFLGNWKMNISLHEARALAAELRLASLRLDSGAIRDCDVIVAPPLLAIPGVVHELLGSHIRVAGQNMHWEDKGAFTGEVSATMLRESGATHVLIGHSERRDQFNESEQIVNRKLRAALCHELTAVLCVGEHSDERDTGRVVEIVLHQIQSGLEGIDPIDLDKVVIAYEPVWAVGTGRSARAKDVKLVHGAIRSALADRFDHDAAKTVRIIYGGSLSPGNAAPFLSGADIDGAIVGAASLNAESFMKIVEMDIALRTRSSLSSGV